ncbi:unnamed protein product, partial [Oncorhynchus mykiss]
QSPSPKKSVQGQYRVRVPALTGQYRVRVSARCLSKIHLRLKCYQCQSWFRNTAFMVPVCSVSLLTVCSCPLPGPLTPWTVTLTVPGWWWMAGLTGEGALKVLSTSLTLRADWERLLLAQLGQGTLGAGAGSRAKAGRGEGLGVPGLSRKDLEKLSEGLVRFLLYTEVSYSLRRLTGLQVQNLYVGPQAQSEFSEPHAPNPLFPGVEAQPDTIKGGLQVTKYFTYNCLTVSRGYHITNYSWITDSTLHKQP